MNIQGDGSPDLYQPKREVGVGGAEGWQECPGGADPGDQEPRCGTTSGAQSSAGVLFHFLCVDFSGCAIHSLSEGKMLKSKI